jgi:hypothetical protein
MTGCVIISPQARPERAPPEQVQMHMEYRLTGLRASIDQQAIPRLIDPLLARQVAGSQNHPSQQSLFVSASIIQSRQMLVGNDQDMDRRLRMGIPEGGDQLIPVNDAGWRLTGDDLTENAG